MCYKAFACMNIAIIGRGQIAKNLGLGLSLAGHQVYIGKNWDNRYLETYPENAIPNLHFTTIEIAAEVADIIFIATNPNHVRETAYILNDVRKKVIVDVAYMNYTDDIEYVNTLNAITSITGSSYVVKCFNTEGFRLSNCSESADSSVNVFVAGDNLKAKEVVKLLSRDIGYNDCHDFGDSSTVKLLDEMAICYHHLNVQKKLGEKIAIRVIKGRGK